MASSGRFHQLNWRRRAARLGWAATVLAVLSLVVLGLAVWAFVAEQDVPASDAVLLFDNPQWRLWLTLAGLAAVVATYLGVAALETAAAMRVLAPDRPLPAQQPSVRRPALRDVGALAGVSVLSPPPWPASAVPARADAVQPCGARC